MNFLACVLATVVENEMGVVVVDCGYTCSKGEWFMVEGNPPFALSSYDMEIGEYVEYCCQAGAHLVKKSESLP